MAETERRIVGIGCFFASYFNFFFGFQFLINFGSPAAAIVLILPFIILFLFALGITFFVLGVVLVYRDPKKKTKAKQADDVSPDECSKR